MRCSGIAAIPPVLCRRNAISKELEELRGRLVDAVYASGPDVSSSGRRAIERKATVIEATHKPVPELPT